MTSNITTDNLSAPVVTLADVDERIDNWSKEQRNLQQQSELLNGAIQAATFFRNLILQRQQQNIDALGALPTVTKEASDVPVQN